MNCHAIFSPDRKYRYRLTRIWNDGVPFLMWIMLNPSTADESRDDPTIKRVIGFSLNLGFGGCVIHNLFAWRSTNPSGLLRTADPVGAGYDEYMIQDAMQMKIVCAWGNVAKCLLWRVETVMDFLQGLDLNYLKLNLSGQPAHPLYLKSKLTLTPMPKRNDAVAMNESAPHESTPTAQTECSMAWRTSEGRKS